MKKQVFLVLAGFVFGVVVVSLIFTGRYGRGVSRYVSNFKNWEKLDVILNTVEKNYVDTVDREALTAAALNGALQSLDPHSCYLEPESLKEADESLAGGFDGIGIQFNVPNDTAIVLDVIPGGPSQKAGLLSGDRIVKVNDRNIAGNRTPQDSMVRLMRGPRGTRVTVTIARGKENIPFDIVRDKIPDKSVTASFMIDDNTGYICLSKFTATSTQEIVESILKLQFEGKSRLILDLRGNTGGFYDQACNIANLFLPADALIVYKEGRNRERDNVFANGCGPFQDLKLSILVDDGTASAAEILAGAMQDNDRGTIVGRRSFGKGLVQEPIYITDGSGIRLTVARFYTPSGRCIQKPYSDDYDYDFYSRYVSGELVSADSIKVDSSKVFKTVSGRTVYGGGGIIPDVFVPIDTTSASRFHISCNKKALPVRFASEFADKHRDKLLKISDFNELDSFLKGSGIEADFLEYASSFDVKPSSPEEWKTCSVYLMPQIYGLCGRVSKVGEEAYYKYVLPLDNVVQTALQ